MNAVDTNILVYAVDRHEPEKRQTALSLLRDLYTRPEPLVLLWQVAVEFVACLHRWRASDRIGMVDLQSYITNFVEPVPISMPGSGSLHRSVELVEKYALSHWDSLLIAACIDAEVETLFTEDMQAGATYDDVRIVNPF